MKLTLILITALGWTFFSIQNVSAINQVDDIQVLEAKLLETSSKKATLSEMVKYFDTIAILNEKEISETNNEIGALTALNEEGSIWEGITLNAALAYPFDTAVYLWQKLTGRQTVVEQQRAVRSEQLADLSSILEKQQEQLKQIQSEKQHLLSLTQNDEQKYTQLLEIAQSELLARQAIFYGKSQERKVGNIKQGQQIAVVIERQSACSTGTHLHFEVREKDEEVDPALHLSPAQVRSIGVSTSPPSFRGTWAWPVVPPVVLTQEYGMSWFARPGGYSPEGAYGGLPHTGIDMYPEAQNLEVYAAADGVLFEGVSTCGGGLLKYMRIVHTADISSYYLHVE